MKNQNIDADSVEFTAQQKQRLDFLETKHLKVTAQKTKNLNKSLATIKSRFDNGFILVTSDGLKHDIKTAEYSDYDSEILAVCDVEDRTAIKQKINTNVSRNARLFYTQ